MQPPPQHSRRAGDKSSRMAAPIIVCSRDIIGKPGRAVLGERSPGADDVFEGPDFGALAARLVRRVARLLENGDCRIIRGRRAFRSHRPRRPHAG